jgi:hypothetical protein
VKRPLLPLHTSRIPWNGILSLTGTDHQSVTGNCGAGITFSQRSGSHENDRSVSEARIQAFGITDPQQRLAAIDALFLAGPRRSPGRAALDPSPSATVEYSLKRVAFDHP